MLTIVTKPFVRAAQAMWRARWLAWVTAYIEFLLIIVALEERIVVSGFPFVPVAVFVMIVQAIVICRFRKALVDGELARYVLAFAAATAAWIAQVDFFAELFSDPPVAVFLGGMAAAPAVAAMVMLGTLVMARRRWRTHSEARVLRGCPWSRLKLFSRDTAWSSVCPGSVSPWPW
jgi:hypothetical protein